MERTTRETWAKRVQRWTESGLTAKEFCVEVGINPGTLAYWKWRLGSERRRAVAKPVRGARRDKRSVSSAQPLSFVELALPAQASGDREFAFEVALAGGTAVRIRSEFDAEALARLLGVLGRQG